VAIQVLIQEHVYLPRYFKKESTTERKLLTTSAGILVGDNRNTFTAGPHNPEREISVVNFTSN